MRGPIQPACLSCGSGQADARGDAPGGNTGRRSQGAGGSDPLTRTYCCPEKPLTFTTTHHHAPCI
eukprot:1143207-Pelagomonas_calceolata.AAC.4